MWVISPGQQVKPNFTWFILCRVPSTLTLSLSAKLSWDTDTDRHVLTDRRGVLMLTYRSALGRMSWNGCYATSQNLRIGKPLPKQTNITPGATYQTSLTLRTGEYSTNIATPSALDHHSTTSHTSLEPSALDHNLALRSIKHNQGATYQPAFTLCTGAYNTHLVLLTNQLRT